MKTRFLTLIFTICFFSLAFSQKKEVHIKYSFFFKDYYPEERQIDVITNSKEALAKVTRTIMYKDIGEKSFQPKSFYSYFFRTKDSIFSKEELGREEHFVSENIKNFKWKLTGNFKTILKYKCQEATTSFRGRDYIAYFTTKIPYKAAPFKFSGLPGSILLIKTTDDAIKIEAKEIEIKRMTTRIENPFKNGKKFISWEKFKEMRIKYWEKFKRRTMSSFSSTGRNSNLYKGRPRVSPGLRMEIIVEGEGGYTKPK